MERGRARNSCAEANVSGRQPAALEQQLQRFAHRDVVVDDEHDGRGIRHGDDLILRAAVDGSQYTARRDDVLLMPGGHAYLVPSAASSASSNAVSLNGLNRHATAPAASSADAATCRLAR